MFTLLSMNPKVEGGLGKASWYTRLEAWCRSNRKRLNVFFVGIGVYLVILLGLTLTGSPVVLLSGVAVLSMVTFVVAWLAFCWKF